AARSRPAGARRHLHPTPHEDAQRHGARHADAGDAERRRDGGARPRARARVRSPVPARHDQTPPGGDRHGRRPLQGLWRRAGRDRLQVRQRRPGRPVDRDRSHAQDAGGGRRPPRRREVHSMRQLTGLLTAVVIAAGIAACGGSSKTAPPPQTSPSAPAAAPATPPPSQQPAAAPAQQPASAAPAAGQPDAAANAAGGRGGRGGTPPPPPPVPPKTMPKPVTPIVSGTAPSPDPRVGLKAGWWDAGEAAWNMRMISTTPPSEKSLGQGKKFTD